MPNMGNNMPDIPGMDNEEMKTKAGQIWSYLDELSMKDKDEYNNFIKKQLEGAQEGIPRVIPTPGFVFTSQLLSIEEIISNNEGNKDLSEKDS